MKDKLRKLTATIRKLGRGKIILQSEYIFYEARDQLINLGPYRGSLTTLLKALARETPNVEYNWEIHS